MKMKRMYKGIAFGILIAVTLTTRAFAHETTPTYDRISLAASAESEVENDVLVASLFVEHRGRRQHTVSKEVNDAIRWALAKSQQSTNVKVQTTRYNTSPLYEKNAITGWRVRQSIRLESTDADQLSELIGELQERLSIGSVNYAVSKATRDRVEETLITQALAQFRRRADLVTRDLGRKSYRIVQITINTQGGHPVPVAVRTRGVAAMAATVPPAIEAGVQTVTVSITATIEISRDADS